MFALLFFIADVTLSGTDSKFLPIYIKEYAIVDTTVCIIVGVLPDNVFKQDPLSHYDSASSPDSVIKHEPLSPPMSTSSENSEVCVLYGKQI